MKGCVRGSLLTGVWKGKSSLRVAPHEVYPPGPGVKTATANLSSPHLPEIQENLECPADPEKNGEE